MVSADARLNNLMVINQPQPPHRSQAETEGECDLTMCTCNGSPKGCERERFGNCTYHDNMPTFGTYSITYEHEGSVCCRVRQYGGMLEAIQDVLDDYDGVDILSVVKC